MATDATGTPTSPDSIPKYNTAADAPSGKGFNAAMDAIQLALTNSYVRKPASIASGEAVVWNGSAWVRSSVTNVGPTSLGSGTPDTTKFLRGDGSWQVPPVFAPTTYRKVTPTTVSNTVAATDILGGAITIGAGVLTATGIARVSVRGICSNATGASQNSLRFQLLLGGTTVWDTGVSGIATQASGGGALQWSWDITIIAANATNSQIIIGRYDQVNLTASSTAWTPTTGGGISMADVVNNGGYSFTNTDIRNTSAKDMTAAQALVLNVIQPVASVNFQTILDGALVEIV